MNVIIPTPAHLLRSISHVCKCMNVIIPTPAHLLRSISHVCKCMNVIIPTPAHLLRSISHVCKCMNVIIPTPAQQLRSISHVCKCMNVTIPTPPHPLCPCFLVKYTGTTGRYQQLTQQWKTTIFNRRYIFKWWISHCYVSLQQCMFMTNWAP